MLNDCDVTVGLPDFLEFVKKVGKVAIACQQTTDSDNPISLLDRNRGTHSWYMRWEVLDSHGQTRKLSSRSPTFEELIVNAVRWNEESTE
jgi:hypothetical protein